MKIQLQLKLEECMMLVTGLYILYYSGMEWWWYLLLFIGPDISMLGYLGGNKAGAALYNSFHHKGVGLILILTGLISDHQPIVMAGVVVVAHSAFDRMLGYGLKLKKGFKYTHLGIIGKQSGE